MNKKGFLVVVLCAVFGITGIYAQSFEEFKAQFEQGIKAMEMDHQEFSRKAKEEFEQYEKQAKAEYNAYINSIKDVWGSRNLKENTKKDWVEYSKDYSSRSVVDFENGKIVVEVAVDDNKDSKAAVDKKLKEAVNNLLQSKGSTCPYDSQVEKKEALTKKPVLDGLVDYSGYNVKKEAKQPSSKELAAAVVEQSKAVKKVVVGDDGKKRTVVQVEMKMVTDNLSKNAALYKDMVKKNSDAFQIEQPLIYAIMEQESSFNPSATSWVPAYGLMQLVPRSGGFDAYRYVYKKEWAPTKSYLYNPGNNIELGTAYLRVLMNQFSKVTDPTSRRLCVIASYNTGAGNVSRAFTGKTSVGGAVKIINTMTSKQVFDHLVKNLSTSEARNYVNKVSQRREKYMKK